MKSLSPAQQAGRLAYYNNIAFGAFLIGGAAEGIVFDTLGDRLGRVRTLMLTIAMYWAFTFFSTFSSRWWHLAPFRFLVTMGIGEEWAVAAALVAEVFPQRARAWSLAIFDASSVFGTWLAVAVGAFILAGREFSLPLFEGQPFATWSLGFAMGIAPALLILLIRWKLCGEPEAWSRSQLHRLSTVRLALELFGPQLRSHPLVGIRLAAAGLANSWDVHIYGKDLLRVEIEAWLPADETEPGVGAVTEDRFTSLKRWEMLGMLLTTTGGGIELLAFGALAEALRLPRAFVFYHGAGLLAALAVFGWIASPIGLMLALPVFGFCFNVARILAAPVLFTSGWLQGGLGMTLRGSASLPSVLFLLGVAVILVGPETKGSEVPERNRWTIGLGNVTVPRGLRQQRISSMMFPFREPTAMR